MTFTEMGRTGEAEFRRNTHTIVLDVAILKCLIDRQVETWCGNLVHKSGSKR